MIKIECSNDSVGLVTEYTIWVYLFTTQRQIDEDDPKIVTVIVERKVIVEKVNDTLVHEHIYTPTIDVDEQESLDGDNSVLTPEVIDEICKQVKNDILNGVIKLPVSFDFDNRTEEFTEFSEGIMLMR